MGITTTEHANFNKTAFFDNREWLNQENWQMYFGGSLPSGVLVDGKLESSGIDYTSALSRNVLSASYIQFRAGAVMANGIYARYDGGTSIPVIKSGDVDRLFVARVGVTAGTVKIVSMTKVAAEYGYTPTVYARMLLQDESLGMTRNETYYDIPLLYEIFGGDVYDLRRLIFLPRQAPDIDISFSHNDVTNTAMIPGILYGRDFVQTYGGMNYNVAFVSGDTATYFYVYPHPACSEKNTVIKLTNNSSVTKQIRLPLLWKSLPYTYSWLESWDTDPNRRYIYKDLYAGDSITLILTPNGHETAFQYTVTNKSASGGGSIDPDDYFTKQEIAAQMLLKANVSDVDTALALKEDKSNLGALAYLNAADYVTQVTNKPTLGGLASKDQANLATDVNGILPIANGGTGASDLVGIMTAVIGENKRFYVSPSGNDNNLGTSAAPFKTIQKAIDSCGIARSEIMIRDGIYTENITIPHYKSIVVNPETESGRNLNITISPAITSKDTITIQGKLILYYGIFSISASTQVCINICDGGLYVNPGGARFSSTDTSMSVIRNGLYCASGGIAVITSGAFYGNISANYGGIVLLGANNHASGSENTGIGGLINKTAI